MANRKAVYTVCPRGEGKKDFWQRIGTAFENRDQSWSIVLDALPLNGKLIMREEQQREEKDEGTSPRRPARAAPSARDDGFGGGGSDDIPF